MFDTHETRMIRLPHGKETMNIAVPSLSVNPPLIDHSFMVVELIPYKDLYQGLKIGVPSGCLGKTSILKVIMIDDVTLWSKLESTR